MGNEEPVYCMHCKKWDASNKPDYCILFEGTRISSGSEAIGFNVPQQELIPGKPSELNVNHDCSHYEDVGFFGKINRRLMQGVPLRPRLESNVE